MVGKEYVLGQKDVEVVAVEEKGYVLSQEDATVKEEYGLSQVEDF